MIYYGYTKDKYEQGVDKGFIVYKGLVLELTQEGYMDYRCEKGDYYVALAIDKDGNDYEIIWQITNPDAENEEDACDWNIYTVEEI